jgi:hypothetical protein
MEPSKAGSWPPGVYYAAIHSTPEDMTLFLDPGAYKTQLSML